MSGHTLEERFGDVLFNDLPVVAVTLEYSLHHVGGNVDLSIPATAYKIKRGIGG